MSGLDQKGTEFPNGINVPAGKLFFDGVTALAEAVDDVDATDGEAAAGSNPTKAEYDVVVTLANETKAQLNALLAALRTANLLDE